jgi:hypothetical protein
VSSPEVPLRTWRRVKADQDPVVLVVAPGRVERAELEAVRSILSSAGIRPLALVLSPAGRPRQAAASQTAARPDAPTTRTANGATRPVPVTR